MPARSLNLGILAHVDAGKTTLTERLLHLAGVIDEPGSVDTGTTRTDTLAVERRRGITVKAAVVALEIDDIAVNVVDTPGHPDFIAEVERVLGVLDGAVVVLSAVEGVQPQTRILTRALQRLRVPTLFFVNKIDRSGADVDRVLDAMRRRLTPDLLVTGSARGQGSRSAVFHGYDDDAAFRERETLALAEHDDTVLADFVDGRDRTSGQLHEAVIAQTRAGLLHPVFAGSAATGAGVRELMAGIADYLPTAPQHDDGVVSGRVFKVERGTAGEKVAYVRVIGGRLRTRDRVDLPAGPATIAGIETFSGGRWARADELASGRIGRVHGLTTVRVGDGFGDGATAGAAAFPAPTLEASVEALEVGQRPALRAALLQLADQDPLIATRIDEAGRPTVSLYGRVQQEVLGATLADEYGIEVEFSEASVLHVERPRRAAHAVIRLNTDENPYQATIGLRIVPGPPGSGLRFGTDVASRDMPLYTYRSAEMFAGAIERHVRATFEHGELGWPVTDCEVRLVEVAYSVADGPPSRRGPTSTAADYRMVTPRVARRALARAGTRVCEPVVLVRLEIPTADAATVHHLLARWGAQITGQTSMGDLSRIQARLVASRLHELQHQLPDLTGGEGVLESEVDGYQPVVGDPPVRRGWTPTTD